MFPIHYNKICATRWAGTVVRENVTVEGRKIPLHDIRVRMLQKQEKFMHLLSDEAIDSMGL